MVRLMLCGARYQCTILRQTARRRSGLTFPTRDLRRPFNQSNIGFSSSLVPLKHPVLFSQIKLPQKVKVMGLSSSNLNSTEGKFVTDLVKSDCVVIFSKTTCGFCQMAKRVFADSDVPYTAIELNQRPDREKIRQVLAEMTGGETVPRVFINAKCVGGGTETKDLQKQGRLLELVKECQASKVKANL